MADALANHFLGDRFEIFSAGSSPTSPNKMAIAVLREFGIETDHLRSKSFDDVPIEHADYVISMCEEQELNCPIFPATVDRLSWAMPDPDGKPIDFFREVRDRIKNKIIDFSRVR